MIGLPSRQLRKPFRHHLVRIRRLIYKHRLVCFLIALASLALWSFLLLHTHGGHTAALRAITTKSEPPPMVVSVESHDDNVDAPELEPALMMQQHQHEVSTIPKKRKVYERPARIKRTSEQQARIDRAELKWNYLADEKTQEYVAHPDWIGKLDVGSRLYFNAKAVFAGADSTRHMHGHIGLWENGTAVWQPKPKPKPAADYKGGAAAAMKHGGFFLDMSDALPLDRLVPDHREQVCQEQTFDIPSFPDSSVVITFFNEPLSTLLRTVYSVLNYTPAPLLREIILVDDHSDLAANLPGGPLYEHVRSLPKVKLMRLAERKGIVQARLAGARSARGQIFVVLDSHIEVGPGWLEPQVQRISESPKSVVFPQILSLTHDTFVHKPESGIGCFLDFRWAIVEHAKLTGKVKDTAVLPSPSMAGGLFAIRLDWFWELGGYDDEFVAWGAENVEMAFRVWMCGGRVECAPCSRTYHVFRKGGAGYANPVGALWRNRRRTARIWMDEYDQLAAPIIDRSASHSPDEDFGPIDKMMALKERLKCKPFKWFLDNVSPNHDVQDLSDIIGLGRVRLRNYCVDVNGSKTPGKPITPFACHAAHNYTGNQGFLVSKNDENRIRLMANDKRCFAWVQDEGQIQQCTDPRSMVWNLVPQSTHAYRIEHQNGKCLTVKDDDFVLTPCDELSDEDKIWHIDKFEYDF